MLGPDDPLAGGAVGVELPPLAGAAGAWLKAEERLAEVSDRSTIMRELLVFPVGPGPGDFDIVATRDWKVAIRFLANRKHRTNEKQRERCWREFSHFLRVLSLVRDPSFPA